MEKNTPIKVLNRDNCAVIYSIPEMNGLRRVFQSGEVKEVTFEELEKLSYIPGGRPLLEESLVILDSPRAIELLLGQVEPEYQYSIQDIKRIMMEGSLDEFLDCLDFSPDGVKEIIKRLAVELPLNDVSKREAILNKLGFNVDHAIAIQKEVNSDDTPKEEKPAGQKRRVSKTTTTRRVVTKE